METFLGQYTRGWGHDALNDGLTLRFYRVCLVRIRLPSNHDYVLRFWSSIPTRSHDINQPGPRHVT